jgi:hypothetical protein
MYTCFDMRPVLKAATCPIRKSVGLLFTLTKLLEEQIPGAKTERRSMRRQPDDADHNDPP